MTIFRLLMLSALALQIAALAWAVATASLYAFLQAATIVVLLASAQFAAASANLRRLKPPTVGLGDAAENAEAVFALTGRAQRSDLLKDVYAMRKCILHFSSTGNIDPEILARGLEAACSATRKLEGGRSK